MVSFQSRNQRERMTRSISAVISPFTGSSKITGITTERVSPRLQLAKAYLVPVRVQLQAFWHGQRQECLLCNKGPEERLGTRIRDVALECIHAVELDFHIRQDTGNHSVSSAVHGKEAKFTVADTPLSAPASPPSGFDPTGREG